MGCYLACTPRAARLAIDGHEAHAYLGHDWDRVAILPEVCITALVGSTTGYARAANGRVEPVLEPMTPMADQVATKQRIRDGVLDFQTSWLAVRARPADFAFPPPMLADIDRLSPAILYRWMDFPTKPEADRLGGLHHDENYFGQSKSATLCDDDNRGRFRQGGARAIFENPRCYWPQGIMAQMYPRMVSVVRHGWTDTRDLGRLGALTTLGAEQTGLIDSELATLEHWLTKFAPRQVIFCGPASRAITAMVHRAVSVDASCAKGGAPRLIIAESAARGGAERGPTEEDADCVVVRGHLGEPATLRAVRAHLAPDAHVALVLSGDLEEGEIEPILHGLTPFLGPKGVILAAAGRYDRDEVETRAAIGGPLKAWFTKRAAALGFALAQMVVADRAAVRDWIVLWHSPEAMDWSRQWMPIVTDLGYDADDRAQSADPPADSSPAPTAATPTAAASAVSADP
jgi:hypothetical protein